MRASVWSNVLALSCILSFVKINLAQTTIVLPKLYPGVGVIFPKEYVSSLLLDSGGVRATPTLDDVMSAETILSNILTPLNKSSTAVENKIASTYNRQYLSWIASDGSSIVLINLLNFKHRRAALKYFPNWQKEWIVGFGSFYEENTIRYEVNLTNRSISLY